MTTDQATQELPDVTHTNGAAESHPAWDDPKLGWSDAELVRHYARRLAAVAQRQISVRLRHKIEPEDLTQSVFRTFFRRRGIGKLEVRDEDRVWGLLVRLVFCKLRNRVVFFQAQRRDVRVERSLDQPDYLGVTAHSRLMGSEVAPDEQAAINEAFDDFMEQLKPEDQAIFAAHLAGYRSPAISSQIGSSEQTVRRRLQHMEQKLRCHLSLVESGA